MLHHDLLLVLLLLLVNKQVAKTNDRGSDKKDQSATRGLSFIPLNRLQYVSTYGPLGCVVGWHTSPSHQSDQGLITPSICRFFPFARASTHSRHGTPGPFSWAT